MCVTMYACTMEHTGAAWMVAQGLCASSVDFPHSFFFKVTLSITGWLDQLPNKPQESVRNCIPPIPHNAWKPYMLGEYSATSLYSPLAYYIFMRFL